jgi:hypothetical protein
LESLGLPEIGVVDLTTVALLPWLKTDDLELSARVIDYWQGGHAVSLKLAAYLRSLGFAVPAEPVNKWQRGASCGIVASKTVTIMRSEEQAPHNEGWYKADTTHSTDPNVIKEANRKQREWARPEELISERALRSDPAKTRFLMTDEVHSLATKMWQSVAAPLPAEDQGPPCARCDGDHKSSSCTEFDRRRGRAVSETLTVGPLDAAYAQIVRDLHAAATPDAAAAGRNKHAPWPRYFICNNKKGGDGTGEHWFTVAYSIRRCE